MKLQRKLLWLGMITGLSTAVFVMVPPGEGESQSGVRATVIATASLRGEVSPCG